MKNRTIAIISVIITLVVAVIIGIFILNRPAETTTSEISATESTDPVEPPVEEDTENLFQGYTQDELYAAYEEAYQKAEELDELDFFAEGYRIQGEIEIAALALYTDKDWATPKHHADDYMLWRNEFHPIETDPFIEVDDIVYATADVNMRASYSTESEIVGKMKKADSIKRIGTGVGEAKGWDKVVIGNGDIVYVSSQYLSTSRPVNNNNTGNQHQSQGNNQSTQTKPSDTPDGGNGNELPTPLLDSDIQRNPNIGRGPSSNTDTDESNISSGNHGEDDTSGITLHG